MCVVMNWAINLLYREKCTVAISVNFGIQSTRVSNRPSVVMLRSNAVKEYLCDKSSNVYGIIMWKNSANFQDEKKIFVFYRVQFFGVTKTTQDNRSGMAEKNLHLIDVINLVGFAHSFNPSTVFDDLLHHIYLSLQRKQTAYFTLDDGRCATDVHLHTKTQLTQTKAKLRRSDSALNGYNWFSNHVLKMHLYSTIQFKVCSWRTERLRSRYIFFNAFGNWFFFLHFGSANRREREKKQKKTKYIYL